jgi:hypothetical protein
MPPRLVEVDRRANGRPAQTGQLDNLHHAKNNDLLHISTKAFFASPFALAAYLGYSEQ